MSTVLRGRIEATVVATVAIAASVAGLRNEFVQDDVVLIAEHTRLHALANWRQFLVSPYWPAPWSEDLYRPLASLVIAVEHWMGGGGPLLFRIVSYLVYAATAVGVLALARRLLAPPIALGASVLFAAHPVHVEAVALGVGQNELLVALAATIMVTRYLDRRRAADQAPGAGDWGFLGGLYLAASLLKEHGLVLPGLLIAAEVVVLPKPGWSRVRGLGGGYAFLGALGLAVLVVRTTVLSGDVVGSFAAEALEGQSARGRALTMLRVVPEWARLLVWPAHLRADYSPQEMTASTGLGLAETLGVGMAAGALAAGWWARRRAPVLSFGLAWLVLACLPISNVLAPSGILLAERTLLLPSVGLVLAAGALAEMALRAPWSRQARLAQALGIATAVLLVAGVARSAERHRAWRDEATFVARIVADSPRSWRAQRAHGQLLFESGNRDQEAVHAYRRAIALAPASHVWRVRNDLARRFWEIGANELAVVELRASLSEGPGQRETSYYLIVGYMTVGAYADAIREADSAMARGHSSAVFGELRALADAARRVGAPPGSLGIRVGTGKPPW